MMIRRITQKVTTHHDTAKVDLVLALSTQPVFIMTFYKNTPINACTNHPFFELQGNLHLPATSYGEDEHKNNDDTEKLRMENLSNQKINLPT